MFWYTCRYTDPFPWWQWNFLFVFFCLFIYLFFAFTKTSLILIACFHIDRGKIFPTFFYKKKHWLSFVFLNLFTFLEKVKNKTAPFILFACYPTQIFSPLFAPIRWLPFYSFSLFLSSRLHFSFGCQQTNYRLLFYSEFAVMCRAYTG